MLYLPRKNVSSEKRFFILPFATGICVIKIISKSFCICTGMDSAPALSGLCSFHF